MADRCPRCGSRDPLVAGPPCQPNQATCLHRLRRLSKKELPYRYQCRLCDKRLKIASGVVEEDSNAL